jgi:colanic acid/amylovoran biosynthesis protein
MVVGITVRSWLNEERQTDYEVAVAGLIDHIVSRPNCRVVVIPQVTSSAHHDDDRETGKRIARMLPKNGSVIFLNQQFTPSEILSVYAGLDYLVGTRFHSVIFALLSQVPAVAIEYEHKTSGIMQDLQLDEWVIPIEAVTAERLIELYDNIITEHDRYVAHLGRALPAYIANARMAADLIAENFAHRVG